MTRRRVLALAGGGAVALAEPRGEFIAIDLRTGKTLESQWADDSRPVACGSLLKIAPAAAYAAKHAGKFPVVVCGGARTGCWSPSAHGTTAIARAVAHSCNTYFRRIAGELTRDEVAIAASLLGMDAPASDAPTAWIGLGGEWMMPPVQVLRAYARLADRKQDSFYSGIIEGLRECARSGTGRALAGQAMAKTGTSPCGHAKRMPGDGWAIGLWPAESPRTGAIVRLCGEPGSRAARLIQPLMRRFA